MKLGGWRLDKNIREWTPEGSKDYGYTHTFHAWYLGVETPYIWTDWKHGFEVHGGRIQGGAIHMSVKPTDYPIVPTEEAGQ